MNPESFYEFLNQSMNHENEKSSMDQSFTKKSFTKTQEPLISDISCGDNISYQEVVKKRRKKIIAMKDNSDVKSIVKFNQHPEPKPFKFHIDPT